MKAKLESIFNNKSWPLEIRIFLYAKKLKNDFLYTRKPGSMETADRDMMAEGADKHNGALARVMPPLGEFLNQLYLNLKFI